MAAAAVDINSLEELQNVVLDNLDKLVVVEFSDPERRFLPTLDLEEDGLTKDVVFCHVEAAPSQQTLRPHHSSETLRRAFRFFSTPRWLFIRAGCELRSFRTASQANVLSSLRTLVDDPSAGLPGISLPTKLPGKRSEMCFLEVEFCQRFYLGGSFGILALLVLLICTAVLAVSSLLLVDK
ncbi:hypothetical protein JCM8097_007176 [Rhodosporidiobolus ruineniae]